MASSVVITSSTILGYQLASQSQPSPRLVDWDVVGAHIPPVHETFLIELPVLVAVRAVPLPHVIMPLVLESHGDAIVRIRPQLL